MVELDIPANMSFEEIEQQRADELAARSRTLLRDAPDLVHHVRSIALASPEGGETLRELNAPMRITAADAADAAFSQLVDWRVYWQRWIETTTRNDARVFVSGDQATIQMPKPWSGRSGEVQGFVAGTTPGLAQILTRFQTRWLVDHADQISAHPVGREYHADVVNILAPLGAQFSISGPIDLYATDQTHSATEYSRLPDDVQAERHKLLIKAYLLPSEAAVLVRVSKRTVNRWIGHGLEVFLHDGKRYVRLEDVQAWMHHHTTPND